MAYPNERPPKTTAHKAAYYIGLMIILATFVLLGHIISQEFKASKVYNICMSANQDRDSEKRCGEAQVANGYEFLCTDTTAIHCWVEQNSELRND